MAPTSGLTSQIGTSLKLAFEDHTRLRVALSPSYYAFNDLSVGERHKTGVFLRLL